jgi:hypothetical protein
VADLANAARELEGSEAGLLVGADVEEADALGAAEPLVAAADEVRGLEGGQIDRNPGECAPSMQTSMPRLLSSRTMGATGKTSDVQLVTWLMKAMRVRGPTLARNRSTTVEASSMG